MKKKIKGRYGRLRYLRIVEERICGQPYQTRLTCWSTAENRHITHDPAAGF
jgi:hypothetical protein